MNATSVLQRVESIPFNETLIDSVVLSWNDLMPEPGSGLIHIEYHVALDGSVEYLKVWASTIRGEWNLVCEHWMLAGGVHQSGLRFAGEYKSDGLGQTLASIMRHQEVFLHGTAPGCDRMLQVSPPTEQDAVAAARTMTVFLDRLAI